MDAYPWATYGTVPCRHCEEPFERRSTNQVYCSSGCRWNWWWGEKRRREGKPPVRRWLTECPSCGVWFTATGKQKFCDLDCTHAYQNKRRHLHIRSCEQCGRLSLGSVPKRFCGRRCRWLASRPQGSNRGLVYFIQGASGGPVKIGRSVDPQKRMAELQTGHFERLHLRAVVAGGVQLERDLHLRFAEWRLYGEWFRSAPEVVAAMEEYAADQMRLVA